MNSNTVTPKLARVLTTVVACGVALALQTGIAGAATPSGQVTSPHLVKHVTTVEYVSTSAPSGTQVGRDASRVPAGVTPKISCGQYLTVTESTSWDIWGTSVVLLSLSSTDYTQWCSGRVYTQSYRIYCHNLTYGVYNFTCLGGNSSGVIGQGTSQVNPWYNQPVLMTYWTGAWHSQTGTGYGRNYLSSNGATNEWFQLNI